MLAEHERREHQRELKGSEHVATKNAAAAEIARVASDAIAKLAGDSGKSSEEAGEGRDVGIVATEIARAASDAITKLVDDSEKSDGEGGREFDREMQNLPKQSDGGGGSCERASVDDAVEVQSLLKQLGEARDSSKEKDVQNRDLQKQLAEARSSCEEAGKAKDAEAQAPQKQLAETQGTRAQAKQASPARGSPEKASEAARPVGPIVLSSAGAGTVSANRWEAAGLNKVGRRGVRGGDESQMCASGDSAGAFDFKVKIEKGSVHQVGVAIESCCEGVDTLHGGVDRPFAALSSNKEGWKFCRGAGMPVGNPSEAEWWAWAWHGAPQTLLVSVDCSRRSFRVGIQGGDDFLGEMVWPDSWRGVYPFYGAWGAEPVAVALEWRASAKVKRRGA